MLDEGNKVGSCSVLWLESGVTRSRTSRGRRHAFPSCSKTIKAIEMNSIEILYAIGTMKESTPSMDPNSLPPWLELRRCLCGDADRRIYRRMDT